MYKIKNKKAEIFSCRMLTQAIEFLAKQDIQKAWEVIEYDRDDKQNKIYNAKLLFKSKKN